MRLFKVALALSLLSFSLCSWSEEISFSLQVSNLNVAQHALQSGVYYIQSGTLVSPDGLNLERPYCYSYGYRLHLKTNTIYPVVSTKVEENKNGLWKFSMILDPQTADAAAVFRLACYSKNEITIQDVQLGLKGVYQVMQSK